MSLWSEFSLFQWLLLNNTRGETLRKNEHKKENMFTSVGETENFSNRVSSLGSVEYWVIRLSLSLFLLLCVYRLSVERVSLQRWPRRWITMLLILKKSLITVGTCLEFTPRNVVSIKNLYSKYWLWFWKSVFIILRGLSYI